MSDLSDEELSRVLKVALKTIYKAYKEGGKTITIIKDGKTIKTGDFVNPKGKRRNLRVSLLWT